MKRECELCWKEWMIGVKWNVKVIEMTQGRNGNVDGGIERVEKN